jgi:[acyl-carrier-protein] S-malonyltransferase
MSKTAIIFPGQGSQFVGMGRDIKAASRRAANVFSAADEILGFPISKICFEGPEEELVRTDIQQPAVFVTSVAVWEAMLERGAPESLLAGAAGLSLGEYTALHVGGSMGFADALKLVAERGRLMQDAALATPSGMVTLVGATPEQAESLCNMAAQGDVLRPANYNCPGQIVISGSAAACKRALDGAAKVEVRAVPLKVAGAFHSPLMEPAAVKLEQLLASTPMTRPIVPVMANVDAAYHGDASMIRSSLRRQITHPVLWARCIEQMVQDGYDAFVEVGPGKVLTGLMRKINRNVAARNVANADDLTIELETSSPR